MFKYLVLTETQEGPHEVRRDWASRATNTGGLLDAAKLEKRRAIYGDETGTPEQYNRIDSAYRRDLPVTLIVYPMPEGIEVNIEAAIEGHNAFHDRTDAEIKEQEERAELARLIAKHGVPDDSTN